MTFESACARNTLMVETDELRLFVVAGEVQASVFECAVGYRDASFSAVFDVALHNAGTDCGVRW
jgi:hypothetical protein